MQKNLLIQGYEVVIGFETHTQLTTASKIFSRSSIAFGAQANTQACAVDLALPGTLPVMNQSAVQKAIEFGLAVGANVANESIFARKNYFYPDLPKGYQISQFELPVVQGGAIDFLLDGEKKTVRLVRAHLEEDAGKSMHEAFIGYTSIDLNRAGTPLLEIVTEPDMRSSAEAVAYAKALHKIVTWIGICDGNMQEGSFRCDANVSVRKPGATLGTRREIKNLNSFKFMQQAIDFEVRWQIEQIEDGQKIEQATVLFNPDTGETKAMRTKEDAADYRYFPDPDLPPLCIDHTWIETTRQSMSELPQAMAKRFMEQWALSEIDAEQLTQSPALANYFELCAQTSQQGKNTSNWLTGDIARRLNADGIDIAQCPIEPVTLAVVLIRIADGTLSNNAAKQVLDGLWSTTSTKKSNNQTMAAAMVDEMIEQKGVKQMNDTGALGLILDEILQKNAKSVAEYKAGNAKAFNALVGQAMKATQGKGNPAQVNALLKTKLDT